MDFRDTINVLCTSGSYTLISYMKGGSTEWNVARDYNPDDKTWSAGNYCYSLESALVEFLKKMNSKFVKSDYQMAVEEKCTSLNYVRMVDLGTQFKDGLLKDDPESAREFFDDVCEMNAEEKTFFGLENAEIEIMNSEKQKFATVTEEAIITANIALSNTPHFMINSNGYSGYVGNSYTNAMLTKEETEKAISLGIHVGIIADKADYHGSHKDDYYFSAIFEKNELNDYEMRTSDKKLSIDPAYEYSHIGEKSMQISDMKIYVQEKLAKDKQYENVKNVNIEPITIPQTQNEFLTRRRGR